MGVRCSCVVDVDPYTSMMCALVELACSLVLMLSLSTVSSHHPDGEVGRYCPRSQCHMRILGGGVAPFSHRWLGPMHPVTATQCPTLSARVGLQC